MREPLDLTTIPPHPQAGQLWSISEVYWHILAIAPVGGEMQLLAATYRPDAPLTHDPESFQPLSLAAFVQRTHRKGVRLVKGPAAPWPKASTA